MLLRAAPVVLFVAVVATCWFYIPVKREIAYALGISGDTTTSCCEMPDETQTGDFDYTADAAEFDSQAIDYPRTSLAQSFEPENPDSAVLGTTNAAGEEKWIEVDLGTQKLRAWEGNRIYMEFSISSGKWFRTPTGDYNIWYKTRAQTMKGGSKELHTYYYLPNVPSNMFFYQGYAIHGAYWHNNFGQPMSHGCVNAPLQEVAQLFEWAGPVVPEGQNAVKASAENPGTRVFVH